MAKYAKNYYPRNLIPQSRAQIDRTLDAGCEPNAVCLACWQHRREVFLESEFHTLCVCPEYTAARHQLLSSGKTLNTQADMIAALAYKSRTEARQLGDFLARIRQTRRRLKLRFERFPETVPSKSFACRRAAWRLKRRASCRHGVLFTILPVNGCQCMNMEQSTDADWIHARFMPALDYDLKIIAVVPFHRERFLRLASLQHTVRQLGW